MSIVKAVKATWPAGKENKVKKQNTKDKRCDKQYTSKEMYWTLIDKEVIEDANRIVWSRNLGIVISERDWEKFLIASFQNSFSTKLRFFQYRVLNNKLVTNKIRNKWNEGILNKCYYCKVEVETILHILYDSEKVKKFWSTLFKWFSYVLGSTINCSKQNVILNNYEGQHKYLINVALMIGKQYIYATKCLESQLSIIQLIGKIKDVSNIEWLLAKKVKQLSKYYKRWLALKKALE